MSPLAATLREPLSESKTWSPDERREELQSLTSSDLEFLRDSAKNSLYILAKGILGYPDINPETHMEVCQWLVSQEKKRRLLLMPRAHLKSTISTISDSIRIVLENPEEASVLIASETATQAQKFLSEIKKHWMQNELLKALFPELVPERFTGPGTDWSQGRASLRREVSVSRQSHWETIGVGGAPTGNHYTRIKPDDLIGIEASRSAAEMQRAKDWNNGIEPLLTNQHKDIIDWTGTRWARNDLYEHIMDFYGGDIAVYTRSAIENGQIIFPQLHTWEEYTRLQNKNPALWYAQYENNPLEGGPRDLPIDGIRSYSITPDNQEVVIDLPDGNKKRWHVSDLDRVTTVDPNSGSPVAPDLAAIAVCGLSPDDELFALEMWSDRQSPDGFVDKLYQLSRKWKPRVVGIEKAGQQNTEFYFRKLCKENSYFVHIEPLKPQGRGDKAERVRFLIQPPMASGKIFLLPTQSILRQQMNEFPNSLYWDELDAFAYSMDLLRRPYQKNSEDGLRRRNQVLRLVMQTRNPRTGY